MLRLRKIGRPFRALCQSTQDYSSSRSNATGQARRITQVQQH